MDYVIFSMILIVAALVFGAVMLAKNIWLNKPE